jgi:DNA repair exonuclease SbcCD ATPase subunit
MGEEAVDMTLPRMREQAGAAVLSLHHANLQAGGCTRAVAQAEDKLTAAREAQGIAQGLVQAIQTQIHQSIAKVVCRCLEAVFDEPYEFRIVFEQKRGRTEARMVFVRGGVEVDPMTASGGGVVDVAAFALRLACLVLQRPAVRRLVVLDEPFKFVSEGYRAAVRDLLLCLSSEMGIQFVMVTHIDELQSGTVVGL